MSSAAACRRHHFWTLQVDLGWLWIIEKRNFLESAYEEAKCQARHLCDEVSDENIRAAGQLTIARPDPTVIKHFASTLKILNQHGCFKKDHLSLLCQFNVVKTCPTLPPFPLGPGLQMWLLESAISQNVGL